MVCWSESDPILKESTPKTDMEMEKINMNENEV